MKRFFVFFFSAIQVVTAIIMLMRLVRGSPEPTGPDGLLIVLVAAVGYVASNIWIELDNIRDRLKSEESDR